MADNNAVSWADLFSAIINYPEKGALILVLIAGAWRWLLELWRESKDEKHHETLMEALIRENKELREELRKKAKEKEQHDL